MTKEKAIEKLTATFNEFVSAVNKSFKGDETVSQDKIELFALVMTMSALYEDRIAVLEAAVKSLSEAVGKVGLSVENLALQTTNNQVETKRILDAIKTGVLDTNLAVKFPYK